MGPHSVYMGANKENLESMGNCSRGTGPGKGSWTAAGCWGAPEGKWAKRGTAQLRPQSVSPGHPKKCRKLKCL